MRNPWPSVPLGEILRERQEEPSAEALANGQIRIISKIGFNDGAIHLREDGQTKTGMILIRPGDLVISGINAAKGAIAIYGEDSVEPIAATIHYGAYIPNEDRINVRFLWRLLRSRTFRELLLKYVPGGIKTELKSKRFLPIPIPLPPLQEQLRILVQIEQLAIKIEEARCLRYQAIKEINVLQRCAVDVALSRASSVCEPLERFLAEPLMNGLSIPASKIGSGIVFAKVGAVNTGRFDPQEFKLVDIRLAADSPYWLKPGDIVVSRGNTVELVGRAAVYQGSPPDCAIPDLLIRIRVRRDEIDPRFLAAFFHSSEARAYIKSQIGGTSSTMPKISQPKLRAMPIPALPLIEQQRIVEYLEGLERKTKTLAQLQTDTAAELDALLPSILDKAFCGELIPTDAEISQAVPDV